MIQSLKFYAEKNDNSASDEADIVEITGSVRLYIIRLRRFLT